MRVRINARGELIFSGIGFLNRPVWMRVTPGVVMLAIGLFVQGLFVQEAGGAANFQGPRQDLVQQDGEEPPGITGTVTGPDGTIPRDTLVDVYFFWNRNGNQRYQRIATVYPNEQGNFKYAVTTKEWDQFRFQFPTIPERGIIVVAKSPGFGPGWKTVGERQVGLEKIELKLATSRIVVTGRVLDSKGNAVIGALVYPVTLSVTDADLDVWRDQISKTPVKRRRFPATDFINLQFDEQLSAPIKTSMDGVFHIHGLGDDRELVLKIVSDGIATTFVSTVSRKLEAFEQYKSDPRYRTKKCFGNSFEVAMIPDQVIRGIVKDKISGEAIRGARVSLKQSAGSTLHVRDGVSAWTDVHGKFRLSGISKPKDGVSPITVQVTPPAGREYFSTTFQVPDSKDLSSVEMQIELQPAIRLSGQLIDQNTKRPVQGTIMYYPRLDNDAAKKYPNFKPHVLSFIRDQQVTTDDRGRFSISVLPGKGVLGALAYQEEFYVHGSGEDLEGIQKDANDDEPREYYHVVHRNMFNVFRLIDIETSTTRDVVIEVVPLSKKQINVVDGIGQPVSGFSLTGRFPEFYKQDRREPPVSQGPLQFDSHVEIFGVQPGQPRLVVVLQPKLGMGAARALSHLNSTERIVLKKCVTIRGQVVDPNLKDASSKWVGASIGLMVYDDSTETETELQIRKISTTRILKDGSFELTNVLQWPNVTIEISIDGVKKSIEIDTSTGKFLYNIGKIKP